MSETKRTPSEVLKDISPQLSDGLRQYVEGAVNARPKVEELVGMIVDGKLKKGLSEDDPFYLDELEAKAYAVKAALGGKAE